MGMPAVNGYISMFATCKLIFWTQTSDSGLQALDLGLLTQACQQLKLVYSQKFALVRLDFELLDAVLDHAAEVRVSEAALYKLVLVQAAVTCTVQ